MEMNLSLQREGLEKSDSRGFPTKRGSVDQRVVAMQPLHIFSDHKREKRFAGGV